MEQEILEQSKQVEKEIETMIKKVDEICEKNSKKVLQAFQDCKLQEAHFHTSTGYGIDELGRNKIEEIYSHIFRAEDSLVRAQLISGTHALAITLSALLRPGDTMISITGEPYDTLQTVIGIGKEKSKSSLKSFQIQYEQIDLVEDDFDTEAIQQRLQKKDVKLVEIQRSRGYSTRKSLTIEKIEKVIQAIRQVNQDVIIMVDNCYGEFVQDREPIEVGADIAVRVFNEKFRSRNCNLRSLYSRKKGIDCIMCRKVNFARNWERNRPILSPKSVIHQRLILCS